MPEAEPVTWEGTHTTGRSCGPVCVAHPSVHEVGPYNRVFCYSREPYPNLRRPPSVECRGTESARTGEKHFSIVRSKSTRIVFSRGMC